MAKPGLTQVTTSQTFQAWLDKTNDIVNILKNEAVTASAGSGDTTTGNATLVGSFTANTVIAFDMLRTDTFSPKVGSTSISATAPINTTTSLQVAQTLTSTSGPRINLSSGSIIWTTGFENTTDNSFIIDVGSGAVKLKLTTSGNLSTAGSITAGTGGFIGNVTGTVSSLSNHTTSNLDEGTNLYFTTARARSSISAGTGITITNGQISIGQAVATTSNVTFNRINLRNASNGNDNTYIEQGVSSLLGITVRSLSMYQDDVVFRSYGQGETNLYGRIIIQKKDDDSNGSLEVNGPISSTGNITVNSSNTTGGGIILSDDGDMVDLNDGYCSMRFLEGVRIYSTNKGGSAVIALKSSGAIIANGDITAFGSSSDIRKKENIVRIDNALEKVSQINGYTYNFKGDDRKITGVIAQELEAVLPEAVYEIDDDEFGKSKAVRYGNIVGLLIEAIKDLKKQVDSISK